MDRITKPIKGRVKRSSFQYINHCKQKKNNLIMTLATTINKTASYCSDNCSSINYLLWQGNQTPLRFCKVNNANDQTDSHVKYGHQSVKTSAKHTCAFSSTQLLHRHHSFAEAYTLDAGLKPFWHKSHKAAVCRMKQLQQCAFLN